MRRPSQKSVDLFNQLIAQQNKVRNQLRRIHKHAEETLGAGRLPALVIPKRTRKIRYRDFFTNRKGKGLSIEELRKKLSQYWARYREMKKLFAKGLKSYLAETVFKGYKDLWKGENGIGEEPEGDFGRYSKEQIALSDKGAFMKLYNQLFTRGSEFFMALLYTGKVLDFKVIYDEMRGLGRGYTYIEQQADLLRIYNSPKERAKLVEEASKVTGYEHSKRVEKTIARKEANARAKMAKNLDTDFFGGVDD